MAHVILFVDDEAEVLGLLRKTFPHQDGYVTLTASSAEEARRIAKVLVEAPLAPCVNIVESCRSVYRWKGEIVELDSTEVIFSDTPGERRTFEYVRGIFG